MSTLFVPEQYPPRKRKDKIGIAISPYQRIHAKAAKRTIDRIDEIEIAVTEALTTGQLLDPQTNEVWQLPDDIVEAVQDGRLRRGASLPQFDYAFEDELEWYTKNLVPNTAAELEGFTDEPGYWLHIRDKDNEHLWTAYPVYGYMLDKCRRNAVPPLLKQSETGRDLRPTWKDAEWLCRCAQCGRELPPASFNANSHHRVVGICKLCYNINKAVDTIYVKRGRYITPEERDLLGRVTELYDYQWFSGLLPRGKYAKKLIGEDNIKKRLDMCYAVRDSGIRRRSKLRLIEHIDGLEQTTEARMLYLFESEEDNNEDIIDASSSN